MRTEKDFLGEAHLPDDAFYGINTWRASQNFRNSTTFSYEWYKAIGQVKMACYETAISFTEAAKRKFPGKKLPAGCENIEILVKLLDAAQEISLGKYFDHFKVPAIQGGAGTAINMNVNEIITNVSLKKTGHKPGEYGIIDPFMHANIFQSTNDVIPTALKVAIMKLLNVLEEEINALRSEFEKLETSSRSDLRTAFTQLQQALPSSFGYLFSAYSDALSRDWWRVSKCFERIKVTNLGGGATGTGMAIPRYYIMEVVNKLRQITNLPVTRSENHTDTTQNLDSFVEIHATLKAHAVNLEKISSDIRLLASDITRQPEIILPQKQIGSSIMPAKVNPVICEFVISSSHKVYANDMLISNLCGQGCLELNAYIPTIGHALLESLELLISSNQSLRNNAINELKINPHAAYQKLLFNPSITTALLPIIGYHKATKLGELMKKDNITIFEANKKLKVVDDNELGKVLLPENILRLGYSLNDI